MLMVSPREESTTSSWVRLTAKYRPAGLGVEGWSPWDEAPIAARGGCKCRPPLHRWFTAKTLTAGGTAGCKMCVGGRKTDACARGLAPAHASP